MRLSISKLPTRIDLILLYYDINAVYIKASSLYNVSNTRDFCAGANTFTRLQTWIVITPILRCILDEIDRSLSVPRYLGKEKKSSEDFYMPIFTNKS